MLFAKVKDFRLRKKFLKLEYKIKAEKFVLINLATKLFTLKKKKKVCFFFFKALYLNKRKKYSNITKVKIHKRCLFNDRTKSIYRPFNLSRVIFREMLQFGLMPGYKKAVW